VLIGGLYNLLNSRLYAAGGRQISHFLTTTGSCLFLLKVTRFRCSFRTALIKVLSQPCSHCFVRLIRPQMFRCDGHNGESESLMRVGLLEAVDLFRKWSEDKSVVRCQGNFSTFAFSLNGRILQQREPTARPVARVGLLGSRELRRVADR
jgi:hypothetical protein